VVTSAEQSEAMPAGGRRAVAASTRGAGTPPDEVVVGDAAWVDGAAEALLVAEVPPDDALADVLLEDLPADEVAALDAAALVAEVAAGFCVGRALARCDREPRCQAPRTSSAVRSPFRDRTDQRPPGENVQTSCGDDMSASSVPALASVVTGTATARPPRATAAAVRRRIHRMRGSAPGRLCRAPGRGTAASRWEGRVPDGRRVTSTPELPKRYRLLGGGNHVRVVIGSPE
jgi:hypothetical protein